MKIKFLCFPSFRWAAIRFLAHSIYPPAFRRANQQAKRVERFRKLDQIIEEQTQEYENILKRIEEIKLKENNPVSSVKKVDPLKPKQVFKSSSYSAAIKRNGGLRGSTATKWK